MTERGASSETESPGVVERVRHAIEKVIHPISTARADQFRQIISVLPEGALKKSYQDTLPKLRDMLKIKDVDTLTGDITLRVFGMLPGAWLVGAGFLIGSPVVIPAVVIGSAIAIGSALWPWGQIAHERKAIANETIAYSEFYRSTAGRDAAKAWDKLPGGNTDQIVRAIIMGTPTMRGMPGASVTMPAIPAAGGMRI